MSLLLDLLFPRRCFGCGKTGAYFCPTCAAGLTVRSPIYNPGSKFDGRLSLFKYSSFIKDSLLDLKYHFITDIAENISCLAAAAISSSCPHLLTYWQQYHFCLVPIPLHSYRQNWRGFNQSELLAKNLSDLLHLDFQTNLIYRRHHTKPQAKLAVKSDRFTNISSAFALNQQADLPENIILFDDVSTTTATLNSALNVLPPLYFNRVWALTIA